MDFETGEISYNEAIKLRRKAADINAVAALQFFETAGAARARAEIDSSQQPKEIPNDWIKVIWYGNGCGGKLVRFKAGSPYLPKTGKRKGNSTLPEEYFEAQRLQNSLSRTKRRIFEIAACNPWKWFFTGTLDGEKCDRHDLNGTFKRLSQFLRDYRKKQDGERLTYLIVPEQHKDGAWHFHGLFNGISEDELHKFSLSENIPLRIKKTIMSGTDVFSWDEYSKRFGYTTFTACRSHEAVSKYVTKYVTKDMQAAAVGSGRHLYYASQGLKSPVVLAEGFSCNGLLPYCDFESDWVACRSIQSEDEARAICSDYLHTDVLK